MHACFRCSLPPSLLAGWPGSSVCHCHNTEMEWTPNKTQHTKLTLEKKILLRLLLGFELATFHSWVQPSVNKLSWDPSLVSNWILMPCQPNSECLDDLLGCMNKWSDSFLMFQWWMDGWMYWQFFNLFFYSCVDEFMVSCLFSFYGCLKGCLKWKVKVIQKQIFVFWTSK